MPSTTRCSQTLQHQSVAAFLAAVGPPPLALGSGGSAVRSNSVRTFPSKVSPPRESKTVPGHPAWHSFFVLVSLFVEWLLQKYIRLDHKRNTRPWDPSSGEISTLKQRCLQVRGAGPVDSRKTNSVSMRISRPFCRVFLGSGTKDSKMVRPIMSRGI